MEEDIEKLEKLYVFTTACRLTVIRFALTKGQKGMDGRSSKCGKGIKENKRNFFPSPKNYTTYQRPNGSSRRIEKDMAWKSLRKPSLY
jgi:hypothetical protein